jgi:CheY-like chemotaxis protein
LYGLKINREVQTMAKILYIEDVELLRLSTKNILEHDGHEVLLYSTGEGAVEYADKIRPDLVLTDHNLGLCENGINIACKLKALGQPVILTSGDSDIERMAHWSGIPFVLKGRPGDLRNTIAEVLKRG